VATESGTQDGLTSQSLLHQVKYSSLVRCSLGLLKQRRLNPFFIRSSIHPYTMPFLHLQTEKESQSLLHQVKYSSFSVSFKGKSCCDVSIPSSSGQVFIPGCHPARHLHGRRKGLNPFFIRSSIHPGGWGLSGEGSVWRLNPFFIRSSIHPDNVVERGLRALDKASQSLLHQVKYSSLTPAGKG